MERLILEFTVGDGYTYSSEMKIPIVYSDKNNAIADFELVVLEYLDKKVQHTQENKTIYDKYAKANEKYLDLVRHPKKKVEKEIALETLMKTQKAYQDHSKELSHEFVFGGAKLEYRDFLYHNEHSGKEEFFAPNVHTLDEFFYEAEQEMKYNAPKALKMK